MIPKMKTDMRDRNSRPTSYNEHTLRVIEFDQVREIIGSLAGSAEGRAAVLDITPLKNPAAARSLLTEVDEIMQALQFDDPLPGMNFHSIRNFFSRLRITGTVLEIEEIVTVADNLETAGDIRAYFDDRAEKYPAVSCITGELSCHDELVKHVRNVITPELEIADNATPELRAIRRKLSKKRGELRNSVETILSNLSDDIISERTITVRDGRYVLPVRDYMKKRLPGAVHDRSQTGKTLFIEPLEIIEGNNQLRELELAEKVEIMRIIGELTRKIAAIVDEIEHNQDILVRIDCLAARARYGAAVGGIIPKINDDPVISIKGGRHPLLNWKYRNEDGGSRVIPLDIGIGGDVQTMVITGPNAGGKTVALKTLGLMVMMALSGIPIPATADSSIFAPGRFFADIGDEQSIEDDLSTFSSHMKHIITILNEAGPRTLVLLDELGGGTNPTDGEAIALAVLKRLTGAGVITLATSHHDGLKVFAYDTPGVINASMEFDHEHHRPAFILRKGVPGSSYAFEIAERMGMQSDVLKDAEMIAGTAKKTLEGLIADMEEHVRTADRERETAITEREKLEAARTSYEIRLEELTEKSREILSQANAESKKMLDDTNRRIESVIKSLREEKASHESIVSAKAIIRDTAKELEKTAATIPPPKKKKKAKPLGKLAGGMYVRVESLGAEALVEEVLDDGRKARIRVGNSKATLIVKRDDLTAGTKPPKRSVQNVIVNVPSASSVSNEIDLRGMMFDEARDALEQFLPAVGMSGWETARIIHGKGSGALRNKIGKYLETHEQVMSFRLGNWNEGSSGVTIVTMKR